VASSLRVLCMRSWRPFCCGLPGSMSSGMAEAHPPSGEPRQTRQGVSSKGHAVVGADTPRQPELSEESRKHGLGVDDGGVQQSVAAQKIAAVIVGDGEREAVTPVAGFELAFVVGAPQLVRRAHERGRFARMADRTPAAFLRHEPVAFEDLAHGTALGPRPPRMFVAQDLQELLRAPRRVTLS